MVAVSSLKCMDAGALSDAERSGDGFLRWSRTGPFFVRARICRGRRRAAGTRAKSAAGLCRRASRSRNGNAGKKGRGAKCSDAGSLRVLRGVLLTPLPDHSARRPHGPGPRHPKVSPSRTASPEGSAIPDHATRKPHDPRRILEAFRAAAIEYGGSSQISWGWFALLIQLLFTSYPQHPINPLISNNSSGNRAPARRENLFEAHAKGSRISGRQRVARVR